MDIRDLRIGDFVKIKNSSGSTCKVVDLESPDIVRLNIDSCDVSEFNILDICGVKANDKTLVDVGGVYDLKKIEYIFTFSGGLRIIVRPKIGTENYTASVMGQYRSPYLHFTYIHELQHWLWCLYRVEL